MPKADTLALTQMLAVQSADAATIEAFYNDTMVELAAENWFCVAEVIPLLPAQLKIELGNIVNLLALIYDDADLGMVSLRLIEFIDAGWRQRVGRPTSYVREDENAKTVALYPQPDVPSNPLTMLLGEPLGSDYPVYSAVKFFSQAPLDPLQPFFYLELVVALRILSREFTRESDHQDQEYGGAAQALSDLFKSMLA